MSEYAAGSDLPARSSFSGKEVLTRALDISGQTVENEPFNGLPGLLVVKESSGARVMSSTQKIYNQNVKMAESDSEPESLDEKVEFKPRWVPQSFWNQTNQESVRQGSSGSDQRLIMKASRGARERWKGRRQVHAGRSTGLEDKQANHANPGQKSSNLGSTKNSQAGNQQRKNGQNWQEDKDGCTANVSIQKVETALHCRKESALKRGKGPDLDSIKSTKTYLEQKSLQQQRQGTSFVPGMAVGGVYALLNHLELGPFQASLGNPNRWERRRRSSSRKKEPVKKVRPK